MNYCWPLARWFSILLASVLLSLACSGASGGALRQSPEAVAQSPASGPSEVPGGCGATLAYDRVQPAWLVESGAHNNPNGVPFVLAIPETAAGFIFGYPLRAGHRTSPSNKILWVVRLPRNGSSLSIAGSLSGSDGPAFSRSFPANSGPGEIYPSIVDVPEPGCWRIDLAWSGNKTTAYLEYR